MTGELSLENNKNAIIEKEYHIPLEIFSKAFTCFQKKFIYPKTYLMILCYFLIIVWQVILIIKDKANNISAFIIMTAFLAIFISWYNPKKVKRNLLESIKEIETDLYKFKLFDDYISLLALSKEEIISFEETDENNIENSENEGNYDIFEGESRDNSDRDATILKFNNAYFSIIEYDEFYILYQAKIIFYVVPKKDFSDEELLIMNENFKNKLGKRFS